MADTTGPNRPDPELLGPHTLLWQEAGDIRYLATIGSALIIQTMLPAIGAAVDQYSVYRTDPWGRGVRSIDSVLLWIYGGQAALEESRRLRELHRPIKGFDDDGRPYHALQAEPYAWVHGTVFAWLVRSYRLIHGRELTDPEQEQLYGEVLTLGRILGIPERMLPPDRAAYWQYYQDMLDHRLVDHPVARNVLTDLRQPLPPPFLPAALHPAWRPLGRVAGRSAWRLVVAAMPPEVRRILGLRWTAADERKALRIFAALRVVHAGLPERLRYLPLAYHARRLARSVETVRARATVAVTRRSEAAPATASASEASPEPVEAAVRTE